MYVIVRVGLDGEECFDLLGGCIVNGVFKQPAVFKTFKEAKEFLRDKQQRYPNALYAIYSLVPETGVNE